LASVLAFEVDSGRNFADLFVCVILTMAIQADFEITDHDDALSSAFTRHCPLQPGISAYRQEN
jgi:hypothetical protein